MVMLVGLSFVSGIGLYFFFVWFGKHQTKPGRVNAENVWVQLLIWFVVYNRLGLLIDALRRQPVSGNHLTMLGVGVIFIWPQPR